MCAGGLNSRAASPALSQEFYQYLAAHHYVSAGLESGGTNKQAVRAKINGKSVFLIVDTSCPRTSISYQCARSLGLDLHDVGSTVDGFGGTIKGTSGMALIQSFQLQFGEINRTNTIVVLPKGAELPWAVDGILGLDYLTLNAALYAVGGGGILFKPGPAPPPALGDYMTKFGFKGIALGVGGGHCWTEGHINAVPMRFMVDTGAEFSNFRAESVRAALHEDMPATKLFASGLDGKRETSFYFTPASMDLDGLDVSHQNFLASHAAMFDKEHFDGLVGFDLLGKHQAILDFGGRMLWMR